MILLSACTLIAILAFANGGNPPPAEPDTDVVAPTDTTFSVTGCSPKSGQAGTRITLEGENWDLYVIDNLLLGDTPLPLVNLTSNALYTAVPSDMESGAFPLRVSVEGKIYDIGTFTVDQTDVTPLASQPLDPAMDQKVPAGNLTVHVPKGALTQPDVLTVEKVNTPTDFGFTKQTGDVYMMEIGEQHIFSDFLTVTLPVPTEYAGSTPLVLYFDNDIGGWEPVESQVDPQGTLSFKTNHLSMFGILYGYEARTSSDDFFKIYYNPEDKGINAYGNTSAKDLAIEVGEDLAIARARYNQVLGTPYQLGDGLTRQLVIVDSAYSEEGAKYGGATSILYLPGTYDSEENVRTTAAHELFHAYQDEVLTGSTMVSNKWWTEAMAEYASKKVAFDITPKIWTGAFPHEPLTQTDEVHEYAMSAFIDYMLTTYKVPFSTLHQAYLEAGRGKGKEAFAAVFASQGSNMDQDFAKFWQQAMTDSALACLEEPGKALSREQFLKAEAVNLALTRTNPDKGTQTMIAFAMGTHPDLAPVRYVKFSAQGTPFMVSALHIPNTIPFSGMGDKTTISQSIKDNMQPGGVAWTPILGTGTGAGGSDTGSGMGADAGANGHLFPMKNNDVLLLSMQQEGSHTLLVREVWPKLETPQLSAVRMGETVEVKYGFDNIFAECTQLLVETDFGDGQVVTKTYGAASSLNISARNKYETTGVTQITGSLYDTTDGKKELIARVLVPIFFDNTPTPTPSAPGQTESPNTTATPDTGNTGSNGNTGNPFHAGLVSGDFTTGRFSSEGEYRTISFTGNTFKIVAHYANGSVETKSTGTFTVDVRKDLTAADLDSPLAQGYILGWVTLFYDGGDASPEGSTYPVSLAEMKDGVLQSIGGYERGSSPLAASSSQEFNITPDMLAGTFSSAYESGSSYHTRTDLVFSGTELTVNFYSYSKETLKKQTSNTYPYTIGVDKRNRYALIQVEGSYLQFRIREAENMAGGSVESLFEISDSDVYEKK